MTTVIPRAAGALFALVRKDLSDVRLLLAFLLALDVAILLLAHFALDEELSVIAIPSRVSLIALGVPSMLPIVAEIYTVDERVGTSALVRSLPVRRWTRALAKVASVGCVIALAIAVLFITQRALPAAGLGVDADSIRAAGQPASSAATDIRFGLGVLSALVLATAVGAIITRNSLVAILTPGAGLGLLIAAVSRIGDEWAASTVRALTELPQVAGHPFGLALAIAFLVAITPLRGASVRSLVRRAVPVVAGPLLLGTAAVAGVAMHEAGLAPPAFDDPTANLSGIKVSPDGDRVAVSLRHHDGLNPRSSIWIADTSTWEFTRVPELAWSTRARWSPAPPNWGAVSDLAGWTKGGRSLLVGHHNASYLRHEYFTVDADSLAVTPSSYEEVAAASVFHGVTLSRTPSGHDVELLDGSQRSIGPRSLRVPERANEAVFYQDVRNVLHRLDRATGEDRVLPVELASRTSYDVSPDGRYIYIRHRGRLNELLEVETGRSREVRGSTMSWTRRTAVCVSRPGTRKSEWILHTMDGEETLTLQRGVHDLIDIDGRCWLGQTWRTSAAYLFDADGTLLRTIFEADDR